MKTIQFSPSRPSQFNTSPPKSSVRIACLLAVLLMLGSNPVLATINVMTNNANSSLGTDANWTLTSPNSSTSAGSFTDGLLNSTNTALKSGSANIHLQSWNITNGLSYTICANVGASSTQPSLRMGANLITNAVPNGTNDQPFINAFSGGANDILFLTNNSLLVIYGTNAGVGTSNSLSVSLRPNNGVNNCSFNISPGSTLTISSMITAQSSSTKLGIVGGGIFNLNGSNSPASWTGTLGVTNSYLNLAGSLAAIAVNVDSSDNVAPAFNQSALGTMTSNTTFTVNNGIAEFHGTNTYAGITKVVDTLKAFGVAAVSSASTLNSGGSTSDKSTFVLATADNGYRMNQISIGGSMRFTNSGGPATLTFTNGGLFTGSATTKTIKVYGTNLTVVVDGPSFDLVGTSTNQAGRDGQFTVDGVMTFNVPIVDRSATGTNGSFTKLGTGLVNMNGTNTYGGATTVSAGTLLLNGDSSGVTNTITVATNAILGGSGKIGGAVTLALGALATNVVGAPLAFTNALILNSNTMNVRTLSTLGAGSYLLWTNTAAAISGAFNATPVIGGAGVSGTATVVTSGGTVTLNVASSLPSTGTNITFSVTGGNTLNLSWPTNYTGWQLQSNSINLSNSNDWFIVAGSTNTNSVNLAIDPTQPNVFYRMQHP